MWCRRGPAACRRRSVVSGRGRPASAPASAIRWRSAAARWSGCRPRSAGKADVKRHQEQIWWRHEGAARLRHEAAFGWECSVTKEATGDRKIGQDRTGIGQISVGNRTVLRHYGVSDSKACYTRCSIPNAPAGFPLRCPQVPWRWPRPGACETQGARRGSMAGGCACALAKARGHGMNVRLLEPRAYRGEPGGVRLGPASAGSRSACRFAGPPGRRTFAASGPGPGGRPARVARRPPGMIGAGFGGRRWA